MQIFEAYLRDLIPFNTRLIGIGDFDEIPQKITLFEDLRRPIVRGTRLLKAPVSVSTTANREVATFAANQAKTHKIPQNGPLTA